MKSRIKIIYGLFSFFFLSFLLFSCSDSLSNGSKNINRILNLGEDEINEIMAITSEKIDREVSQIKTRISGLRIPQKGLKWAPFGTTPTADKTLKNSDAITSKLRDFYISISEHLNIAIRAIDEAVENNPYATDYNYISNELSTPSVGNKKGAKEEIEQFHQTLKKFRGLVKGISAFIDNP